MLVREAWFVFEIAYLLNVDAVACAAEDETSLHCPREALGLIDVSSDGCERCFLAYLVGDLLLLFTRKVDKVVVLGAD